MNINVMDSISLWIITGKFITQMTPFKKLLCTNTWAQGCVLLMTVMSYGRWGGAEKG